MIDAHIDPFGFTCDELAARGALVERTVDSALVLVPAGLAVDLAVPEECTLAASARDDATAYGLGSALLDRLLADVRAHVPVASVAWQAEPPRPEVAERLAARIVVRNGVADVVGIGVAPATYLAGVFAWAAEADDRYEGMVLAVTHAGTAGEPDSPTIAAISQLLAGDDPRVLAQADARAARGGVAVVARRAALAIGPRLDEVGAAVARRRDRERERIEQYFTSLIAEAKQPRRRVAREAIDARVAALHAERGAKLRDLAARYTIRVRLEPVALAAVATRVAEVRVRLRRRKGERELALQVPSGARAPDALACAGCPGTTRAPLLCDDALHVLCEACGPSAVGRPRCPACRTRA